VHTPRVRGGCAAPESWGANRRPHRCRNEAAGSDMLHRLEEPGVIRFELPGAASYTLENSNAQFHTCGDISRSAIRFTILDPVGVSSAGLERNRNSYGSCASRRQAHAG